MIFHVYSISNRLQPPSKSKMSQISRLVISFSHTSHIHWKVRSTKTRLVNSYSSVFLIDLILVIYRKRDYVISFLLSNIEIEMPTICDCYVGYLKRACFFFKCANEAIQYGYTNYIWYTTHNLFGHDISCILINIHNEKSRSSSICVMQLHVSIYDQKNFVRIEIELNLFNSLCWCRILHST